jgi:hypothetical protein
MHFAGSEKLHRSFAAKDAAQDDNLAGAITSLSRCAVLLSTQHVDHPVATDTVLQHYRAAGTLFRFPNADRIL